MCVRIAAPRKNPKEWGDFHFAVGVKQALERRGHVADVAFRDDEIVGHYDIVISLRGLVPHEPVPFSLNVLWSISHPDLLTIDEIDRFDLFFTASLSWPNALAWAHDGAHHTMLQSTDRARFFPGVSDLDIAGVLLFVGNSRGVDRSIVTQALNGGLPLAGYGNGWEGRIPAEAFRGAYIPNESLGAIYGSASYVLNDHWDSMRQFGYISNRIFDVTASGGSVISDDLPSLHWVFGFLVVTIQSESDLVELTDQHGDLDHSEAPELAAWVLQYHAFDNRVDSILKHVEEHLFSSAPYRPRNLGDPLDCELCRTTQDQLGLAEFDSSHPSVRIRALGAPRRLSIGIAPQRAGMPSRRRRTSGSSSRLPPRSKGWKSA